MTLWDVYELTTKGKGKFLGKGATATVRLIQHKETKKKYALKTVQLSKVLSKSKKRSFRREVDMIRSLDHPNIIKITETFTDEKGDFHLVMPFCDGGELFDHLVGQKPARLSEPEVWAFAKDMFGALNYLRKCHICHRDIKLENYLFSGKSEQSNLLLVDFGFSEATPKGEKLKKSVGTLYTMAPEVIRHNASYPADVWAVGVVLYTLLYGQYPFGPGNSTRQQMIYDIKHGEPRYPTNVASISKNMKDFLQKVFIKDHETRMTASEALKHPWLKNVPVGMEASSERSISRHTSSLRNARRRASTNPEEFAQEKRESTAHIIEHMSSFRRMSTLKRMALLAIAQTMDHEKIHNLTDAFAQFDTKNDGTIQWSELRKVLEEQDFIHNDEEKREFKDLFRTVDQDHTGYIKYTEFIAACLDARDYTEEEAVHEAFHRLDVNRTGGITKEDMIDLLKNQLIMEIKDKNVEDVVDEMFQAADKGNTGEINLSDLRAILQEEEVEGEGEEPINWRTASNRGSSIGLNESNSSSSKDDDEKDKILSSSVSDVGITVTDTAEELSIDDLKT